MSNDLPRPTPPFEGRLGRLLDQSEAKPLRRRGAPDGAPNVLLILLDDVGFGACGTFGGPVPTPALDRIANMGLRYNRFHTTALCSPTRAALLTGRNHHTVHMGVIPEGASSFPGYDCSIPPEAACVAQVLRMEGYATAMFGKWHLVPTWEIGPAGPFDRWPVGMGFDRFYGFLGGEASQWEPALYDQTTPITPYFDKPGYHLTEDLADQTVTWLRKRRSTRPDDPFFIHFATGAMHCPHHVAAEWSDRFRGAFDDGWDALRDRIVARQLELGVIPEGTINTPRPDVLPAWADYPDRYKPVASRLMEVFAGFLAHTDAQIGRVLDELEAAGELDNTLVFYITGDNGASAEAGIHGAWSAVSFQNGVLEDPEWLLEHMDDFGTERCENHYNAGWAWALDAPFPWYKQVASHFGGTRNGMAVSWPKGIRDAGAVRSQFHHVVDIAATIYEAAGITPPDRVNGIEQLPLESRSMVPTFERGDAPEARTTQYFEMFGNRAVYHEGWMASCFHGRQPWERAATRPFDGPQEVWELYDLRSDFSQSNDLAASEPTRLAEMIERFDAEARRNNVYPMRDPGSPRRPEHAVPASIGARTSMTYTTDHVRIHERIAINMKNCSYRITGSVTIPDDGSVHHGVIACQGGNMGGWSLYLDDDGHVVYLYNWVGHVLTSFRSPTPLAPGAHDVVVEFAYDGGMGQGGSLALHVDGALVDSGRIERTIGLLYSISGESFDVGIDTGAPVGPYHHGYRCTAQIHTVTLERLSEPPPAVQALIDQGLLRASIAGQ